MLRWLGIALLAVSWLLSLGYYHDPGWPASVTDTVIGWQIAHIPMWVFPAVVGIVLLAGSGCRAPHRLYSLTALVLLIPALFVLPMPPVVGPFVLPIGLALSLLPDPRRLWQRLSCGGIIAGVVLIAQSVAVSAYEMLTAYSHDLPRPLAWLMVGVAKLLGINASFNGTNVVLHSMRETNHLAPTWDLFLPVTTVCFLAGGLAFLAVKAWSDAEPGRRGVCFWKAAGALTAAIILWLPLRVGLQMALYVHRILRTGYDDPLVIAYQSWSNWVLAFFLIGPVLLAWRCARVKATVGADGGTDADAAPPLPVEPIGWRRPSAVALAFLAALALAGSLFWNPVGERKAGRVIFDESHSEWESTERPYDTEWYGKDKTLGLGQKSAYNYAVLYDYVSRFYNVSRLGSQLPDPRTGKKTRTKVTDEALKDCDVFIVKCVTQRYGRGEIDAIHRFVERGGGLLLIGEHTNVFKTGVNVNDIAERYGFQFRYDCLFGPDATPFDQLYPPAIVPHPIAQRMPPMNFAISCSIEPTLGSGRAVIRGRCLKNLPAYYHVSNYYPSVKDWPYMRFGSFIELWSTQAGKGRVIGYGDSTILSTFSLFEPGKSEMALGMIEWLNHRNSPLDPRWPLLIVGLVLLAGAAALAWTGDGTWVVALAAVLLGWAVGVGGVRQMHDRAMPAPKPLDSKDRPPFVTLTIDRTICDAGLSKSGFVGGRKGSFALFERWLLRRPTITVEKDGKKEKVLRPGYFTSRRAGADAFNGDLLVFLYPHKQPSEEFLDDLVRYVEGGGRVLVIDAPENTSDLPNWALSLHGLMNPERVSRFNSTLGLDNNSTANALLAPFGLSVTKSLDIAGDLHVPAGWPSVPVSSACAVNGGRPLMRLKGHTVAATKSIGKGSVTVIGFGQQFSDPKMGMVGDVVPDEKERQVYELEFKLIPAIVEDRLPELGPVVPAADGGTGAEKPRAKGD